MMHLERELFYISKNKKIILCKGVSISETSKTLELRYLFTPPQDCSIKRFNCRDKDEFFTTLKLYAKKHDVTLPKNIGEEYECRIKGLIVKKRTLGIRTPYADAKGKIYDPYIAFRYDGVCSYNSAVKNALKVLEMYKVIKGHISKND